MAAMTFDEVLQTINHNPRRFLLAYIQCASITEACKSTNLSRTSHYTWLQESDDYRLAFELAKPIAIQALEDEAIRRAQIGCDEPVFYQGVQCGVVRKYSDSLMALLLKGHKPDTYKDRVSSDVSIDIVDPGRAALPDDKIAALIDAAKKV